MKDTLKNTVEKSSKHYPKTDQEKAEALQLLDVLLNELAKDQALAEVVQDSLPPRKP